MPNITAELERHARELRRESITLELRRRIRPVCRTTPEDLFLELIERMAEVQLKYELIEQRARD